MIQRLLDCGTRDARLRDSLPGFLTPPPFGHPLKRGTACRGLACRAAAVGRDLRLIGCRPFGTWPAGTKSCIPMISTKKSKASHFGLSWTKGMGNHGVEFYPPPEIRLKLL